MASEIRVNTINNRSGLGTITLTDTGAVFSGVTTISDLRTSGTSVVAAGTTAAPSISPTGDSNTGIFFPSADTIAIAKGGAEALRIDSSGRVGVGTNLPTSVTQFQVLGTSAGNTATFGGINQGTSGRVGGIILGTDTDNSSRRLWGIRGESNAAGQLGIYCSSNNTTTPFSGTEYVALTSGGNVKINNGNLVFSTAGTGIDFSADSNAAGMTSELLDDYEEGTHTCTASNGVTLHSTADQITYTKIGRVVTVGGQVQVNSSNSNSALVLSLPFTVKNNIEGDTLYTGAVRLYNAAIAADAKWVICQSEPGTATVLFINVRNNTSTSTMTATDNGYYMFQLTYIVA